MKKKHKKKFAKKPITGRDEAMLALITRQGGAVRTFEVKKKKLHRKRKHKKAED
jgi:hypothetical protein